jgi:RimJ/RimL family protein N-acetyltransferase
MTASLGYWAGRDACRQRLHHAAVRAVVRYAFEDLDLHRVEAACQPDNMASRRVLEKPASRKKASRAPISRSTAPGAITCCSP